jgi:hypothetical protein
MKQVARKACYLLHDNLLFGLLFDPEHGGDIFCRNIGWFSVDYKVLYTRRQNYSIFILSYCCISVPKFIILQVYILSPVGIIIRIEGVWIGE